MTNEYQFLADQLKHISDNNIYGQTAESRDKSIAVINKAADILTTLATVSDGEPEMQRMNSPVWDYSQPCETVDKEYADHYRNKAMQLAARVAELERANAHESFHDKAYIAELEKQLESAQKDEQRWNYACEILIDWNATTLDEIDSAIQGGKHE